MSGHLWISANSQQQQLVVNTQAQLHQQQFSSPGRLYPSNMNQRLNITVIKAKLNKNYGVVMMHPYVRLHVGHTTYKTPTNYFGAKTPLWNKLFYCYLPTGVTSLYLEVFDETPLLAPALPICPPIMITTQYHPSVVSYFHVGPLLNVREYQQVSQPRQPVWLTDDDIKQMQEMFPAIDRDLIKTMLENNGGQFQATQLWYEIINYLRQHADVGRKRYLLKHYDNVFTGSNAVDIVFAFLQHNESELLVQNCARENAVKVCQALMDSQIFESLVGKGQFEDCSTNFYRFLEVESWQFSPLLHGGNEKSSCNLSTSSKITPTKTQGMSFKRRAASLDPESMVKYSKPSMMEASRRSPLSSLHNNFSDKSSQASSTSPALSRRHSFTFSLKSGFKDKCTDKIRDFLQPQPTAKIKNNFLTRNSLRASLARLRPRTTTRDQSSIAQPTLQCTSQNLASHNHHWKVQDHVREAALSYLLSLIDVPILEPILMTCYDLPKVCLKTESPISENHRVNFAIKPTMRQDLKWIPWVREATACTYGPPSGIDKLWSAQACKQHCYQTVVEYYQTLPSVILPDSYIDIYIAIIHLLRENKLHRAQTVLQLLMIVLPWQRRLQLHKLLKFLKLVSCDIFVSVDKEVSNHKAIIRDFSGSVLSHALIPQNHSDIFLDFCISKTPLIFSVSHLLNSQSIIRGPVFCEQVSEEVFKEHHNIITIQALQQLLSTIQNSSQISEKEKKAWLKKFQKVHPQEYNFWLLQSS
ncbi:DEP domain-containing protein 7-like isoform X2 [Tachypleus tridentatus]|uniref:DEP domain-containing protein 7-like isoform X2 n=1 Tax=Tachypleus tridentatus TaxID=6853 RepID=UPI003FCFDAAF